MKKSILFIAAIFIVAASFAQNEKYIAAMKKNLAEADSAFILNDPSRLTIAAAAFERIGDAEKTQWLPFYHAAYCHVMFGYMKNDPSSNDGIADKTEQLLAKAEAIEKNNSEISLLKAMTTSLRMMVNPMERWMQYGPKIQEYSQAAISQDPNNPRPHWFNGVSMKNTPEQFGGGCGVAKPMLEKAIELFGSFQPASELHPSWGKPACERDLAGCK